MRSAARRYPVLLQPWRAVGLALARRALALSLAEPSRFEVRLRFENPELDLGPKEWPANRDFLLARAAAGGELVDLTEDDIRLWMFWFGLDYILNH
jgi:hypothetical protein